MKAEVFKDLVHGFRIPHDKVLPIADNIIVRVPTPPKQIGSIITPQQAQDIGQHNIVAGRVEALGPLAFSYTDASKTVQRMDVVIGDWVIFRPHAGTFIQPDGKVGAVGGVRYISSFRDVTGILKHADMGPANRYLELALAEDANASA